MAAENRDALQLALNDAQVVRDAAETAKHAANQAVVDAPDEAAKVVAQTNADAAAATLSEAEQLLEAAKSAYDAEVSNSADTGTDNNVIDLTTYNPAPSANPNASITAKDVVANVRFSSGDDSTRRNVAYILLGFLAALILFHIWRSFEFANLCVPPDGWKTVDQAVFAANCKAQQEAYEAVADQSQNVFTAIIGLVGSVVGFYFGSKTVKEDR